MFKRAILLFFIAFILKGCATIVARDQYVAVDSSPRGAQVFKMNPDGSQLALGKTPLTIQQPLARRHQFNLKLQDETIRVQQECELRSGSFLLGNTLIAIGSFPLGAFAFAWDLYNDHQWWCPEFSHADFSEKLQKTVKEDVCRNIFMISPKTDSVTESFHFYELIVEKIKKAHSNCINFPTVEEMTQIYQDLKFGWHQNFDFKKVLTHKKTVLRGKYKKNVFIVPVISQKKDSNTFDVELQIYDLYKNAKDDSLLALNRLQVTPYKKEESVLKNYFKNFLFHSLPNNMSFTLNDYNFSSKPLQQTLERSFSSLALGFKNIRSLESLERWKIRFGLYPSFQFSALSFNDVDDLNHAIDWQIYSLSAQTHLQALMRVNYLYGSVGVGFGPAMHYEKSTTQKSGFRFNFQTSHFFRLYYPGNQGNTYFLEYTQLAYRPQIDFNRHFVLGDYSTLSVGIAFQFTTSALKGIFQ